MDCKIGYLNVNGLARDKMEQLLQTTLPQLDVLFLAETWHLGVDHYKSMQEFIGHTPLVNRQLNRRQDGGIMAIRNPNTEYTTALRQTTEHTITVSIGDELVTAVYLPPSMPLVRFEQVLDQCSHGTIVGDVNTRYGQLYGDRTTGPKDRMAILDRVKNQRALNHVRPTSGNSRTDHLLTKTPATLSIQPAPVVTDHAMMWIELTIQQDPKPFVSIFNQQHTRRFRLKGLRDMSKTHALGVAYKRNTQTLGARLSDAEARLGKLTVEQRLELLDDLELDLLTGAQAACREVLGTYTANQVRNIPEDVLNSVQSNNEAVKLFKRAMRAKQVKMEPRDPTKNVEREVEFFFEKIFSSSQKPPMGASSQQTQLNTQEPLPDHSSMFDKRIGLSADTIWRFGIGHPQLAARCSTEAVWSFFQRYDSTKACGLDSIHTIIVRALLQSSNLSSHLAGLYRLCALTGLTPSRWNTSVIYPLPKVTGAKYIDECRPVALTAMFRRCFESFVLEYMVMCDLGLHPCQAGFRRGHSTLLHAMYSNDIGIKHNATIHRVFIDLKQAYDRVPIDLLIKKLVKKGVDSGLVSLIISLFTGCGVQVVVNGALTNMIECYRGLFQGSLLSPLLFLIFIDDLAWQLDDVCKDNSNHRTPSNIMYADDVQCITTDGSLVQPMCDTVTLWCDANGMMVSITKCGYMGSNQEPPTLQHMAVPVVSRYKYLGFPHGLKTIDFKAHLLSATRKAQSTLNYCRANGNHWPPWVRLVVYKTFIRPVLEYGAQLAFVAVTEQQIKQLDEVQEQAIKWTVPQAPNQRIGAVVLGVPRLWHRYEGLAGMFYDHMLHCAHDHPVRALITSAGRGPWPHGMISPRVASSKFMSRLPQHSLGRPISSRTALKMWYMETVKKQSRNGESIPRHCRTSICGPDYTIYLREDDLRDQAIRWRTGSFGFSRWCLRGHRFNKACVVRGHIDGVLPVEDDGGCPLDQALNDKDLTSFQTLLEQLTAALD